MVQDVSCGEGNDPKADDQAADGDDPLAGRAVMDAEGRGFVRAEKLATEADDHEQNAESEGEPCHRLLMYRMACRVGKREMRTDRSGILKYA
jgi:hypothetical protein